MSPRRAGSPGVSWWTSRARSSAGSRRCGTRRSETEAKAPLPVDPQRRRASTLAHCALQTSPPRRDLDLDEFSRPRIALDQFDFGIVERHRHDRSRNIEHRLRLLAVMQHERDADHVLPVAAVLLEARAGARQDFGTLLLERRHMLVGHAGMEHQRSPDQVPDERLHRVHFGDLARDAFARRRHGIEIERDVRAGVEMRRRDEARGGGARLADKGAAARGADDIARLAGAAIDAAAHDIAIERKPVRGELAAGALEQTLRLLLGRAARLALKPQIDEALPLPVVDAFAHECSPRWRMASSEWRMASGEWLAPIPPLTIRYSPFAIRYSLSYRGRPIISSLNMSPDFFSISGVSAID